ncbi:MAG: amidophosphoribosyltransferase [Actinobacteria bacterium]|nr:amidophosphoribosyltransferase [Actinomycetota bacterium]
MWHLGFGILKFFNDKPEEACGVFGIYAPSEDVAKITYYGLYGLQHRGQESAGIAVSDGSSILVIKDLGLVSQVFDENKLASLSGKIAIGHTRYSTTGSTEWKNSQPIYKTYESRAIAIAHNGNLVNAKELYQRLKKGGKNNLSSTSDSEVIAEMIVSSNASSIEEAIKEVMLKIKGAYSLVILTEDKLIGVRDPYGIRPLSIGKLGSNYVLSSETAGLDIVGALFVREVEPGEIVVIDKEGLHSHTGLLLAKKSLCVFEFIYFARPDSYLYGQNLYHVRKTMGMKLAEEGPVDGDLVIPVPDSGNSAAIGFAERSGIPFGEGLIKNRYIGRTFIQPSQTIRQLGIRLKLNPLRDAIAGKRLVVVDDSIVRGNTSKKIVEILKEAGAKEVHMRISSPPIKCPCFYGIDTPSNQELIASTKSVEEIKEFLGLDSLVYLSLKGVVEATGCSYEDFCCACFDGRYPIEIPKDLKISKDMLEEEDEKVFEREGHL